MQTVAFTVGNIIFVYHLCRNDDLRAFSDLINTEDVEAGGKNINHWINQPADRESGETLIEIALTSQKKRFVEVLLR